MPRTLLFSLAVATTLATGFNAHAQKAKPPIPTDAAGRWKWEQMEQGPFFSSNLKGSVAALKTLTLRVGSEASPAAARFRLHPYIQTTSVAMPFYKNSTQYKEFVELCEKRQWKELPREANDKELKAFMAKGDNINPFSRLQVQTKFRQWRTFCGLNRPKLFWQLSIFASS